MFNVTLGEVLNQYKLKYNSKTVRKIIANAFIIYLEMYNFAILLTRCTYTIQINIHAHAHIFREKYDHFSTYLLYSEYKSHIILAFTIITTV